ncbi:hypothetical protein [Clostridium sp. DL-VIII]|nr:hypothetical protein [Clostridium sp. DL-VIII]
MRIIIRAIGIYSIATPSFADIMVFDLFIDVDRLSIQKTSFWFSA